jgi:trehalose 6-phosphate phosphatase
MRLSIRGVFITLEASKAITVKTMPYHALHKLDLLCTRMRGRSPWIFLDFDGTISPIAATPTQALIDPRIKQVLEHFAVETEVAIISGRSLADLRQKVAINNISYVGAHGLQLHMRGMDEPEEPLDLRREKDDIARLDAVLREQFGTTHGLLIENKTVCLAVHYRQRPDIAESLHILLDALVHDYSSVRIAQSKMAVEIRPKANWDKGSAIEWLSRNNGQFARLDRFPLYIGDDCTDQDAFRVVRSTGVGVYVGAPKMCGYADFFVENVDAVYELLRRMADEFYPRSVGLAPPHVSEMLVCPE